MEFNSFFFSTAVELWANSGASLVRTLQGLFYRSAGSEQVFLTSGNIQLMHLLT